MTWPPDFIGPAITAASLIDASSVLCAAGQVFALKFCPGAQPPDGDMAAFSAEMLGMEVQVALAESGDTSWIELFDYGAYQCADDGITIARSARSGDYATEALLGPIMLHALARRGVFVLHASAAISPGGELHAFSAGSGTGKSTVARLSEQFGWRRVADDLLPLSLGENGLLMAHPHLPQPKLSSLEQYPAAASPAIPVAALIRLARGAETHYKSMSAISVVRLVLESTVAARVYSQRAVARHFDFAGAIAAGIDAGRLRAAELVLADMPQDLSGAVKRGLDLLDAKV